MNIRQKIKEVLTNRSTPTTYHNKNRSWGSAVQKAPPKKPTNAMLDKKYGKPSNGIGVGP